MQSVDESDPAVFTYLPVTQLLQPETYVHAGSLAAVRTAKQPVGPSRLVTAAQAAASASTDSAAASTQLAVAATAPADSPYVPWMQFMQAVSAMLPVMSRYFPAPQLMQSPSWSLPIAPTNVPSVARAAFAVRCGEQVIHLMELPNPDPAVGRPDHAEQK